MRKIITPVLLGILFVIFVSYCLNIGVFKHTKPFEQNNIVHISTSFYPLYFFAHEIGGDKADVTNITPAGAEPHDYEPTSRDIARIEESDMLVLNGAHLETWGDKIRENLQDKKTQIVVAGDVLADRKVAEEGKTIQDPHVWLSPRLAKQEVTVILDGYLSVDPRNGDYYKAHADKLEAQLDSLDEKYKQGLAYCKQKDIITSHAAFGYLGRDYRLNQVTIAGLSPDEEPSSKQLADVANFARKNNVQYIFFESLVSSKLAETIANEVGAKTLVLDPIEGISDEDMKAGRNYFTIMEQNLANLRIALECQ